MEFSAHKVGSFLRLDALASQLGYKSPDFQVEKVFSGGMGCCLKLKHTQNGTLVALKMIKSDLIGDTDIYERFTEELKMWFSISSCDGVAEALRIVQINEIPCMCAAWMDGEIYALTLKRLTTKWPIQPCCV